MNDSKSKIIIVIEEVIDILKELQGSVLTPSQKAKITNQNDKIKDLFISAAPESLDYMALYYDLLTSVLSSSIEKEIRNNSKNYIGYYLPKLIKTEQDKIVNTTKKAKKEILIACGKYFIKDYQESILKVHEKYNLTSKEVNSIINECLMQLQGVTKKEQIDFSLLKQAKINLVQDYFTYAKGPNKYCAVNPVSEGFLRKTIDEIKNEEPILFEKMKQERDDILSAKKIEEGILADKINNYIKNGIDYDDHHILFTVIDYYCLTDIDPMYLFKNPMKCLCNSTKVDEQTLCNIRNAHLLLETNALSYFKTNITLNENSVTLEELESIENILKSNGIKVTKISMGIALDRYFKDIPILPLISKESKRNLSC